METRAKKEAMAIQTRSRRAVVAAPAARIKAVSRPKKQLPETKKESPRKEQVEPVAGSSKILTRVTRSRREASVEPKPLVSRKRKVSAKEEIAGAASKEAEKEEPRNTRQRGKEIPPEVAEPRSKRKKAEEEVKKVPRGKKNAPKASKATEEVPKEKENPPLRKRRERGQKNPPGAEIPLRTRAKAPPKELKEAQVQVETESDKENENLPKNQQSPTNTSGEKKPIYKIINTVTTHVPMDQLIVMSEEAAPTEGVYEFESSQNSNGNAVKKKPRKRTTPKSSKPTPKQPKFWDPKKLRKFQQKSAAEARAAKLLSVPAHILEKVKEKEKAKRQSLHVSTPLRKPSPPMNMDDDVFSPIVQKENPMPETNEDETEVFEDNLPEPHTDTPEPEAPKADVQPWRTDKSILLPSTSHIRQSERDFLPTYSSEMIVKATPKKPKPSPKVIKTPTSPQKTPRTADYTLTNYFGFDTEEPLEVDEGIAKRHGEEALQKERERLKALAPVRKTPAAICVSSRRARIKTLQQLTLKEAIPSTSRNPPETQVVQNLFEPQRPEMRRSYSRPRSTSKMADSEDEEEQQVVIKKKKKTVKEYEGKPKKALSKKDKKHEEELNEFCTSFNEMCDEVEQFDVIVE